GGALMGADPATVPVLAILGAAMVLAVMQRAPLFAGVIAWELTWAPLWTLPLLLSGAVGAYLLAHRPGRSGRGE
ncbi:chloride channel protein, partial [Corynebacterium nasicanis]